MACSQKCPRICVRQTFEIQKEQQRDSVTDLSDDDEGVYRKHTRRGVSVEDEVQDDCEVEEEHRMLQEEQDYYCSTENGLYDVNNDENTCRKHSRQSVSVEDMSSEEEQDTDIYLFIIA